MEGTFPLALCDLDYEKCMAKSGNPALAAPCGTTGCCDLGDGDTCTTPNGNQYELIKENYECNSGDAWLGEFGTVQGCADQCAQTSGCRFFIYGIDGGTQGNKAGNCYHEKTSDAECSEDWESDSYDFYEVLQDSSGSSKSKTASLEMVLGFVVAAVLLVATALFLAHKHAVAARQPHRDASMPNVGAEDEAEA